MAETVIKETPIDAFWLPKRVRESVISEETRYATLSFSGGRECGADDDGAITVRWPRLVPGQWRALMRGLGEGRRLAPRGDAFWNRLQSALETVARRFADRDDPFHIQAATALPSYTGYSEPMIRFTLGALDLMRMDDLPAALAQSPTRSVSREWTPMLGLAGRIRFYESSPWRIIREFIPHSGARPLFQDEAGPELVVGYGAGNVPGTALLIGLLSQAVSLCGQPPPVAIVKNSRREPIFSPLVLSALEEADPELLASLGVMIWDYSEESVQQKLLSAADLVVAAASDQTIAQIRLALGRAASGRSPRLHEHGHKVSFSAVAREILLRGTELVPGGQPLLDVVTLLAGLDSAFWDQQGCLSSRVHFVETGPDAPDWAELYAERLAVQMRLLATFLPRGAGLRQQIRDRFDRYKLMEITGKVRVVSEYEDEFVVAVDRRSADSDAFVRLVNDCVGRVIIVRPVEDLMCIPDHFLRMVPPDNLQSLSVAIGGPGEGLSDRFLRFAGACGARGVTAIRTVGRGAFPQLAYSWDGLIPPDLIRRRLRGRFATIEFDAPFDEMLETFRLLVERGELLGLAGN